MTVTQKSSERLRKMADLITDDTTMQILSKKFTFATGIDSFRLMDTYVGQ